MKDNRLQITDKIVSPWVSSGKNEKNEHYAPLGNLQEEIKANLLLTLKNGQTIKFSDLGSYGLTMEARFYNDDNWSQSGAKRSIRSSPKIQTHTLFRRQMPTSMLSPSSWCSIRMVLTTAILWNPLRSQATPRWAIPPGWAKDRPFTSRTRPVAVPVSTSTPSRVHLPPMQLIKMSADKPPESATSEGYYKTENVKVTSGNGEDGKTYIYYQLKLVTNQASLNLPATITDQLPDHVKYVAGSAKLVAQYYGNQWNNYYYEFVSYTATGGSHKGWNNDVSLSDDRFFANKYDSTKNTLTFNLLDELNYVADKYTSFYIRFAVEVDDTIWDSNLESETKTFTNSAEWTGVGKSETKTDVEHHSTLATKSGHYNQNSNTVDYSVVINPDRKMIGHAEKITLTDTLVVKDGKKTPQHWFSPRSNSIPTMHKPKQRVL